MSFDQNALDSLKIERTAEPVSTGSSNVYKWLIGAVLVLALVAGAFALLRDNAIEVETASAVAAGGGGSGVLTRRVSPETILFFWNLQRRSAAALQRLP